VSVESVKVTMPLNKISIADEPGSVGTLPIEPSFTINRTYIRSAHKMKTEGGYTITKNKYTRHAQTLTLNWTGLTYAEKETLKTFFGSTTKGGFSSFLWDGGDRFHATTLLETSKDDNKSYSATIGIKELPEVCPADHKVGVIVEEDVKLWTGYISGVSSVSGIPALVLTERRDKSLGIIGGSFPTPIFLIKEAGEFELHISSPVTTKPITIVLYDITAAPVEIARATINADRVDFKFEFQSLATPSANKSYYLHYTGGTLDTSLPLQSSVTLKKTSGQIV
jgi:hypothetical protein